MPSLTIISCLSVSWIDVYFQKISVVNNVIHDMNVDALHGLNNLKQLRLERCLLRRMPPICHVKDTLHTLIINGNSVANIPGGYFDDCDKLAVISLANNKLTHFPDVSPIHQSLTSLSVISNQISTIPIFMVENKFVSLKYLMVSDNKIHSFPPSLISTCPNMQEFFITNNNLHTLEKSAFEGKHSGVTVTLAFNPWSCDSALAWLCDVQMKNYSYGGIVREYKTYGLVRIRDYGHVTCEWPRLYAGVGIKYLSMSPSY